LSRSSPNGCTIRSGARSSVSASPRSARLPEPLSRLPQEQRPGIPVQTLGPSLHPNATVEIRLKQRTLLFTLFSRGVCERYVGEDGFDTSNLLLPNQHAPRAPCSPLPQHFTRGKMRQEKLGYCHLFLDVSWAVQSPFPHSGRANRPPLPEVQVQVETLRLSVELRRLLDTAQTQPPAATGRDPRPAPRPTHGDPPAGREYSSAGIRRHPAARPEHCPLPTTLHDPQPPLSPTQDKRGAEN